MHVLVEQDIDADAGQQHPFPLYLGMFKIKPMNKLVRINNDLEKSGIMFSERQSKLIDVLQKDKSMVAISKQKLIILISVFTF